MTIPSSHVLSHKKLHQFKQACQLFLMSLKHFSSHSTSFRKYLHARFIDSCTGFSPNICLCMYAVFNYVKPGWLLAALLNGKRELWTDLQGGKFLFVLGSGSNWPGRLGWMECRLRSWDWKGTEELNKPVLTTVKHCPPQLGSMACAWIFLSASSVKNRAASDTDSNI